MHDQVPVTVSLESLHDGSVPFSKLEEAFGPSSLGIILVKDLPDRFHELRRLLLSYSSYLANLPEHVLTTLENSEANYLVGWSHGKETLKSGQFDTHKGSYYINCAFYRDANRQLASINGHEEGQYDMLEYTAPNVWPTDEALAGFQSCAQELCGLIIDSAALVARACDKFADKNIEGYQPGYLERVVRTSSTTKARLLHYFPSDNAPATTDGDANTEQDDWCATHIDHSCLTGLTSAMFIDEAASPPSAIHQSNSNCPVLPELPVSPDPKAGLYIRDRSGTITLVKIPRDCLAFQTGEALEVITRGKFKAVPHFVRGVSPAVKGRVARNTLAVFTQPNLHEIVDEEKGLTFADFAQEIVKRYK